MVTHSANSNESISIHKKVLENIRKKVNEYRLNKAMIAGDEAEYFTKQIEQQEYEVSFLYCQAQSSILMKNAIAE